MRKEEESALTEEKKKDIEERLFQEVAKCKVILQYIDSLYDPINLYKIESAQGFFNNLYVILVDYLVSRVMRLFDPAKTCGNDNFSLKKIKELFPDLDLNIDDQNTDYKKLKDYRNKYLSHLDYKKDENEHPAYKELKKSVGNLINALFDALVQLRQHNGNNAELARMVLDGGVYSSFNELISLGAFLNSKRTDQNYWNIINENIKWHEEQREKDK